MTSKELAAETGIAERYAREWLSHQAASGYLDYDPAPGAFTMTPEQAMVFADSNSPVYSRSLRNDGYGADSSPSRGDISRHAFRPNEASNAAVCYVRSTSIRDGRSNVSNAQIAAIAYPPGQRGDIDTKRSLRAVQESKNSDEATIVRKTGDF